MERGDRKTNNTGMRRRKYCKEGKKEGREGRIRGGGNLKGGKGWREIEYYFSFRF